MALLSINWNPDPVLFELGSISIRYYGLLWVVGLSLAYLMIHKIYRDKKIPDETFEPLFFYCLVGIILGARLGHCLFYEPGYYLHNITEMLLPIKYLPDGNWKFTGYQGLASHGGSIGALTALYLYSRKYKIRFTKLLDIVAIGTPIVACFIRLANLMNSEIIGRPTDVAWAFVFENVDMVPRHPAQLYEALFYLSVFVVLIAVYKFWNTKVREGFYFGYLTAAIFIFRFFIELLKEDQVDFEQGMTLNMGQLLSIPFIITGIYFMFFFRTKETE